LTLYTSVNPHGNYTWSAHRPGRHPDPFPRPSRWKKVEVVSKNQQVDLEIQQVAAAKKTAFCTCA
jgi:hypothetical protein